MLLGDPGQGPAGVFASFASEHPRHRQAGQAPRARRGGGGVFSQVEGEAAGSLRHFVP